MLVRPMRRGARRVGSSSQRREEESGAYRWKGQAMKSEGKQLQKELAQYLREQDAAQLRLLRARINAARVERRHMLSGARLQCRTARTELRVSATRSTARERSQEDDDAVRSNLPAELVPVFNAVGKRIKGSAKKSRTEAFLDWAEENPDEIISVQQANADRELKQMLKEQREQGRNVRDARRYKQSPEELRKLLAAVPF